jgi:hypothetical protein
MKRQFGGIKIKNDTDSTSITTNIDNVLGLLKDTLLNHVNPALCNKILFWLNDWGSDYLLIEKSFDYESLIKYEQWSIIECHLGFKVGSEAGGLHYAAIIDKDNAKNSPVAMIIPFKSLDDDKTPDDIDKKTEVYLGNQLFNVEIEKLENELNKIDRNISLYGENDKILRRKYFCQKDLRNLKKGTIAQVGQMCSLSKMRIYYPTQANDKLYGIKLSPKNISDIVAKFKELYF